MATAFVGSPPTTVGSIRSPTWARNGNALVYLVGTGGLRSDVEIMAPDGSGVQTVLADQDGAVRRHERRRTVDHLQFEPAGRRCGRDLLGRSRVPAASLRSTPTAPANRNGVSRSGAGDRIVYTRHDPSSSPDVWIDDALGGPRPLLAHRFADFMPSLSHDGSRVVVSRNEQNGLASLPRVLITDLIAQSGWKLAQRRPGHRRNRRAHAGGELHAPGTRQSL